MNYKEIKESLPSDRKYLFVPIGVPGCGKSTLCKEIIRDFDALYISSDLIRQELLGSEEDQSQNARVFEEFHKRIKNGISEGRNVVCDATNISKKSRSQYAEHVNQHNKHNTKSDIYESIAIEFETPFYICVINDLNRGRSVGEGIISRMCSLYSEVSQEEGFSRNLTYSYFDNNYSDIDIKLFRDFLISGSGNSKMIDDIFSMSHTIGRQNKVEQTSQYHQEDLTEHIKRIVSPMFFEENEWNDKMAVIYEKYPAYKKFVIDNQRLLLAIGIFHDIGKPMCRRKKEENMRMQGWEMTEKGIFARNGKTKQVDNWNDYQFLGHESVSSRLVRFEYLKLLKELDFSDEDIEKIICVVEGHLLPNSLFQESATDESLQYTTMREKFGDTFKLLAGFYVFDNNGNVPSYGSENDDRRNEIIIANTFGKY